MKPSHTEAQPPGTASPTGGEDSVTDALRAIGTSVLDQLLELRQEEVRIDAYRQRAETMKATVDPLVWQHVVSDYQARLETLKAQARPLKAQARTEYAKLRVLLERVAAAETAARVSKAELDFRHAVGELDAANLEERLQGPVSILARCGEDLATVGALKTRFVEAFGAEIELEEPSPAASASAPPSAAAKPAAAQRPATPPAASTRAASADVTPAPTEGTDATTFVMVDELHVDATIIATNVTQPLASSAGTAVPDAGATVLHTPAAPSSNHTPDDHTFLLPPAALLITRPDDPTPHEYRLAAVNYLGRSEESHVQIAMPGVSRRHAVILAAQGGFVIQDLDSQNGVFINGDRVSEHLLKDGEQIMIGDSTVVYRAPWPPRAARGADARSRTTKA